MSNFNFGGSLGDKGFRTLMIILGILVLGLIAIIFIAA